jgi:16S rRNA processing protein RimM
MLRDQCSQIGYISKPHGISGEVVFRLKGLLAEDINIKEPVFVEFDETLVPFFIRKIRPSGDMAFVSLEFIDSEKEASELRGKSIFIKTTKKEAANIIAEAEDLFEFEGWTIVDKNSDFTGEITGYSDESGNPLFHILRGNEEFYIPVQEEFIKSTDEKKKIIYMELPEGLLNIND